jgi:hypothetical protein
MIEDVDTTDPFAPWTSGDSKKIKDKPRPDKIRSRGDLSEVDFQDRMRRVRAVLDYINR